MSCGEALLVLTREGELGACWARHLERIGWLYLEIHEWTFTRFSQSLAADGWGCS